MGKHVNSVSTEKEEKENTRRQLQLIMQMIINGNHCVPAATTANY